MKKTFGAAPFTNLQISLEIHPTIPDLQEAYAKRGSLMDVTVQAFCYCRDGENGVIAELHFCENFMPPEVVAHEALHAALILGRHISVNPEDERGEELLADTAETVVAECLAAKRELLRSRRKAKKASTRRSE